MIVADHLTKIFPQITGVDDITFTLGKGEVLGFLGPNGSGKSTTMKMIAGFLNPTSGTALVAGCTFLAQTVIQRDRRTTTELAPMVREEFHPL